MRDTTFPSNSTCTATASGSRAKASRETKKSIRGSSLLLAGRLFALAVNFIVQVITVRYLTKSDYGAFAYAMSVMTLGSHFAGLGLDKGFTRFVPIYHEKGEYQKMSGTIVLIIGTILGLGIGLCLCVIGLQSVLADTLITDPLSLSLILIVIALAPVTALENVLEKMFAIFAKPSALFFRRHVLGPGLKLGAVVSLVICQGNVLFLAVAYLLAGLLGTLISLVILSQVLRTQDLWKYFRRGQLMMPARALFRFSLPLLSTDMVFALRGTLVVFLLGFFHTTASVAAFRAVLPVARLNVLVFDSFKLLFVPLAGRMFARGERDQINELYWRNASWIAVLTFPLFVMSFSLAEPTTVLLFGERYAESGSVLAVLSLGIYINAAFGFNALILRVFGKVRTIVTIDAISIAVAVIANVMLVPPLGALGGAIASSATLVVQNVLYQFSLIRSGAIDPVERRFLKVYATVTAVSLCVLVIQTALSPPVPVGIALAVIASLLVMWSSFDALDVGSLFPEVAQFAPFRRFLKLLGVQ